MNKHWTYLVADLVEALKTDARMKVKSYEQPSIWGWIIAPTEGYLETSGFGPHPEYEIEWIEIKSERVDFIGKLIPPKKIDLLNEILIRIQSFNYEIDSDIKVVKIYPN